MFDSNCIGEISRPINLNHNQVEPMRGEVFFELLEEKNHKGIILPTGYRQTNDTVHGRIVHCGRDTDGFAVKQLIIASKHQSYQLDFLDKTVFKIPTDHILAVME